MLNWFWKVRIYRSNGDYCQCYIGTERDLTHINLIQEFYFNLTGCKMLLEGMSEHPPENTAIITEAFANLWKGRIDS